MANDIPSDFLLQVEKIRKYVTFKNLENITPYLYNIGYYRLSRYGKVLLKNTNSKQPLYILLDLYNFDRDLRALLFKYCKICEIKIKSYISNYISLDSSDGEFYLNRDYYTASKGERNKVRKLKNIKNFERFIEEIKNKELEMRKRTDIYSDFSIYNSLGDRAGKKIPIWAFFNYVELGTTVTLYSFLNLKYKKMILKNRYPLINSAIGSNYFYSWLKRINLVRNYCAHHNMLIYKNLFQMEEDKLNENEKILVSNQDLLSTFYALKKILSEAEGKRLLQELKRLIKKSKIDIIKYKILPIDWEERYNKIKSVHI